MAKEPNLKSMAELQVVWCTPPDERTDSGSSTLAYLLSKLSVRDRAIHRINPSVGEGIVTTRARLG